jgi:hypothetical protein
MVGVVIKVSSNFDGVPTLRRYHGDGFFEIFHAIAFTDQKRRIVATKLLASKKCGRGDSVDLTDVVWPRDNPVHTLDRALGFRQCKTERRADFRPDLSLCGCTNRRTQHRDRR